MIDDEELREIYQAASQAHLQTIAAGLQQLTADSGDPAMLEALRAAAHSLKGDSKVIGLERIAALAEQIEAIARRAALSDGTLTAWSDQLSQGLAAMSQLIEAAVAGTEPGLAVNQILGDLQQTREQPPQPPQSASPAQPQLSQPPPAASNGLEGDRPPEPLPQVPIDEELRSLYQTTSLSQLKQLAAGLDRLVESDADETVLTDLISDLHRLKGDSQSVGAMPAATLAQQMASTLKAVRAETQPLTPETLVQLKSHLVSIEQWIQQAIRPPSREAAANLFLDDIELREIYQATSAERLQALSDSLAALAAAGVDDAAVETLRGEAHSLKGDSHAVGLESIAQLAAQVETTAKNLQRRAFELTPALLSRLEQSLNALRQLVQEAIAGRSCGVDLEQTLTLLADTAVELPAMPTETATPVLIEDQEFCELYRSTSEARVERLATGLTQLSQSASTEEFAALKREAHSLKGDARAAGIASVEALAYALEESFEQLEHQAIALTPQLEDALRHSLDAIAQLVQTATTGSPSEVDLEQIVRQLKEAAEPTQTETPAASSSTIEDQELQTIYLRSSRERLSKLEAGLARLETQPAMLMPTLAELLREAHSLKGDSNSAGVESVGTLTHALETVFGGLQQQSIVLTPELSDRLYQGVDAIAQLLDSLSSGSPAAVNLEQLLSQLSEAAAAPAQPATVLPEPVVSAIPDSYQIDTVRVQTSDLDRLMNQAEQLTITRIQIAQATTQIKQLAALWDEWKAHQKQRQPAAATPYETSLDSLIGSLRRTTQENSSKLDLISEDLGEQIRVLRLLPLSSLFQTLPRTVRDLARQQEKQIELIIEGQDTTADKRILEEIRDALLHLVRNAIDHGIESPAERVRAGKSPTAKLWLRGYQTPNSIVIEVADDGRGLDLEKIKQTALRRKLHSAESLAEMSPAQIQELILAPGFSTRTFITELSGRGVGLDVVRTNVERLQGNIQIDSSPGQGCTFRLQLSTSLATVNVVLIETAGLVHALPIEFLQTTLLISPEDMIIDDEQITIVWHDQVVPIANLFDVLELPPSVIKAAPAPASQRPCLLLKVGDSLGGFFIDRLLETQEVILKPKSALLKRVRNVTGATILGSGDVCMILNPPDLVKSLQRPTTAPPLPAEAIQRKPVILLVEDSPPVRTQEKRLFEGAGYEVVIAEDGRQGYELLRNGQFDIVVSDVEMPHLDGLSLTAKIRQHPEYDELPIVLVTTLSSDEDRKRGADVGADAYIAKGKFNQDILLETLARLV
ncbi:MAG: response regulator [Leptolyngbya sp. SIO4C1]|nr:response regulator [Leptolyngbya sp. SIO4C1]